MCVREGGWKHGTGGETFQNGYITIRIVVEAGPRDTPPSSPHRQKAPTECSPEVRGRRGPGGALWTGGGMGEGGGTHVGSRMPPFVFSSFSAILTSTRSPVGLTTLYCGGRGRGGCRRVRTNRQRGIWRPRKRERAVFVVEPPTPSLRPALPTTPVSRHLRRQRRGGGHGQSLAAGSGRRQGDALPGTGSSNKARAGELLLAGGGATHAQRRHHRGGRHLECKWVERRAGGVLGKSGGNGPSLNCELFFFFGCFLQLHLTPNDSCRTESRTPFCYPLVCHLV